MALSFLQLQNKVLGWLDEGDAVEADEQVVELVKEALVEADLSRSMARRWPFLVDDATLVLTPGQRVYALDASFRIPMFFWNETSKASLIQNKEEQLKTRDFSGGLLDDLFLIGPRYGEYVLRGRNLILLWTPATADVISYGFYKVPVEMTDDADEPNIPFPESRVLIYDTLLEMAVYNEDLSTAKVERWTLKQQQYENALDAAYMQENDSNSAGHFVTYNPD